MYTSIVINLSHFMERAGHIAAFVFFNILRNTINSMNFAVWSFRILCHKCVSRMAAFSGSSRNVSFFINNFIFKHSFWFTMWWETFLTVWSFRMLCLAKWEQLSFNIYLDHFKTVCNFLDTPKLILNSWGSIVWARTLKAFSVLLCRLWEKERVTGGAQNKLRPLILLFLCKA